MILVADMVPMRSSRALPGPREISIGPGFSPDGDHRLGRQEVRDIANGRTHQEMRSGGIDFSLNIFHFLLASPFLKHSHRGMY